MILAIFFIAHRHR